MRHRHGQCITTTRGSTRRLTQSRWLATGMQYAAGCHALEVRNEPRVRKKREIMQVMDLEPRTANAFIVGRVNTHADRIIRNRIFCGPIKIIWDSHVLNQPDSGWHPARYWLDSSQTLTTHLAISGQRHYHLGTGGGRASQIATG